jgi:hypothetical protein
VRERKSVLPATPLKPYKQWVRPLWALLAAEEVGGGGLATADGGTPASANRGAMVVGSLFPPCVLGSLM